MKFKRGAGFALVGIVMVAVISALGGCRPGDAQPLIDRAFSLVYPELSARIVKEFRAAPSERTSFPSDTYIPLPVPSGLPRIDPKTLYIASPAVAQSLKDRVQQNSVGAISLLAEEPGLASIVWDSAWAYRQMGLIAGYRTAKLRKSTMPEATASMLFSRGIGRSDEELKAFQSAFAEGAKAAGLNDLESGHENLLSIVDVDAQGLHGDRLEQTLAACSQMLQKRPALAVIAAGSLNALEKTSSYNGTVLADLRGLGQNVSKKKLYAAIEENIDGIMRATAQLVRAHHGTMHEEGATRVKPNLILSAEARRDLNAAQR